MWSLGDYYAYLCVIAFTIRGFFDFWNCIFEKRDRQHARFTFAAIRPIISLLELAMKTILAFILGVITGIAGVFVWQMWGKPTEPAYDGWADEFLEPDDYLGNYLEDTQPIKAVE